MDRPETWERGTWLEVVDSADAEHLTRLFQGAGIEPPPDLLATARSLEREVMSGIDAAFPDARPTVARLKRMGLRVFVATNATESNARGALAGASLLDALDGVFTGERLATGKATPAYWRAVRRNLGEGAVPPASWTTASIISSRRSRLGSWPSSWTGTAPIAPKPCRHTSTPRSGTSRASRTGSRLARHRRPRESGGDSFDDAPSRGLYLYLEV